MSWDRWGQRVRRGPISRWDRKGQISCCPPRNHRPNQSRIQRDPIRPIHCPQRSRRHSRNRARPTCQTCHLICSGRLGQRDPMDQKQSCGRCSSQMSRLRQTCGHLRHVRPHPTCHSMSWDRWGHCVQRGQMARNHRPNPRYRPRPSRWRARATCVSRDVRPCCLVVACGHRP